jgi:hypothetical protein
MTARRTGALLVASAIALNGAFLGLGSVFDYPQVLQLPGAEALQRFASSQLVVAGLFTVLALGAAALAPIALGLGRLSAGSRCTSGAVVAGVAAAAVQVAGLLRWPLLVPGLASTVTDPSSSPAAVHAAVDRYELLGRVLGGLVGEAAGYALTAAFTVLVIAALRDRWVLPRIPTALALASVPLILAGLLVPGGVHGASLVNFAGYVLWSAWIVTLGVRLLRTGTPGRPRVLVPVDAPRVLAGAR